MSKMAKDANRVRAGLGIHGIVGEPGREATSRASLATPAGNSNGSSVPPWPPGGVDEWACWGSISKPEYLPGAGRLLCGFLRHEGHKWISSVAQ